MATRTAGRGGKAKRISNGGLPARVHRLEILDAELTWMSPTAGTCLLASMLINRRVQFTRL